MRSMMSRRPVVFWPETYVAVLIAAFVVITERVTASFSRLLVEPAARENVASRFNAHHCGTGPSVLDRRLTLEAGFSPMIDVSFPGDVVGSHAIMR